MTDAPPPGWYPDPSHPERLRWWDGHRWTPHERPAAGVVGSAERPGGRLRPVGAWLAHVFELAGRRAGHLVTIAACTVIPATALAWVAAAFALDGVEVRVGDDAVDVQGWDPGSTGWLALAGVVLIVGTVGFTAAGQHQLWTSAIGQPAPWSRSLGRGPSLGVRLLGWAVVLGAGVLALAVGLSAMAVVLGPVGFVPVLALLALALVAAVVLQFLVVAVVATRTNPLRAAAGVMRTRFWPMLGRTIIGWLVGVAVSFGISIVGQILAALAGSDVEAAVTTDGSVDVFDFDPLFPNPAVAVVLGVVSGLQAAAAQIIAMAGHTSMYLDADGAAEPDRV